MDRIHSSYDKLRGAGSYGRMTENEYRLLRQHPNMVDTSDMNRLLEIARLYDVSSKRQRIMYDLELTKHKERLLGENITTTAFEHDNLSVPSAVMICDRWSV